MVTAGSDSTETGTTGTVREPARADRACSASMSGELVESGEGRNRTGDTTVFSRVLYQLSYLARGGEV